MLAMALKAVALRMVRILVAIVMGGLLLGYMGGWHAQHTVSIEEMQPGGRARLGSTGSVSLIGGDGSVVLGPGISTGADFGSAISDAGRYTLAIQAGFSAQDAITAVAVSIAEDGNGDPARKSARNQDGSYDLGLWQINSARWASFGGEENVKNPAVNARAAFTIFSEGGWCRWFTYEPSCGPNHNGLYRQFLDRARQAALPQPWHDLPAFNQYDPKQWGNPTNFHIWSPAACSAAALRWILTAYGHPLPDIDDAVSLIGPYTGITPAQGLSDHTGPGLVTALGRAGFKGWNTQLKNTDDLRKRIRLGPLMLDGRRWFGVGHWFVAMGSDDDGIFVRESSGNNVTYLTWARLSGEVGWSGWVVGVQDAPAPSNQA